MVIVSSLEMPVFVDLSCIVTKSNLLSMRLGKKKKKLSVVPYVFRVHVFLTLKVHSNLRLKNCGKNRLPTQAQPP